MAETIDISESPNIYQRHLRMGDAHGGPNGYDSIINDQSEVARAVDEFCNEKTEGECKEFIKFLENKSYDWAHIKAKYGSPYPKTAAVHEGEQVENKADSARVALADTMLSAHWPKGYDVERMNQFITNIEKSTGHCSGKAFSIIAKLINRGFIDKFTPEKLLNFFKGLGKIKYSADVTECNAPALYDVCETAAKSGVLRANNLAETVAVFKKLAEVLGKLGGDKYAAGYMLVESFKGLLTSGYAKHRGRIGKIWQLLNVADAENPDSLEGLWFALEHVDIDTLIRYVRKYKGDPDIIPIVGVLAKYNLLHKVPADTFFQRILKANREANSMFCRYVPDEMSSKAIWIENLILSGIFYDIGFDAIMNGVKDCHDTTGAPEWELFNSHNGEGRMRNEIGKKTSRIDSVLYLAGNEYNPYADLEEAVELVATMDRKGVLDGLEPDAIESFLNQIRYSPVSLKYGVFHRQTYLVLASFVRAGVDVVGSKEEIAFLFATIANEDPSPETFLNLDKLAKSGLVSKLGVNGILQITRNAGENIAPTYAELLRLEKIGWIHRHGVQKLTEISSTFGSGALAKFRAETK